YGRLCSQCWGRLGARGNKDGTWGCRITKDIPAPGNGRQAGGLALDKGQVLTRKQQGGGPAILDVHAEADWPHDGLLPGNGGLERVTWPPDVQVGNQAQAGGVLDGLVRGTVFA